MIWAIGRPPRVHATLHSLRHTNSQPAFYVQSKDDNQWKIVASWASFLIFLVLLCLTIFGIPAIATELKKRSICSTSMNDEDSHLSTASMIMQTTTVTHHPSARRRICPRNATWNRTGVTVAGRSNGSCSTSLFDLHYPNDIYVFGNGTMFIADYGNNRIVRWDANSNVGVMAAGTGNPGSWSTLLTRPVALTIRDNQMFVSDADNYRIQVTTNFSFSSINYLFQFSSNKVFPINMNVTMPEGTTIIGRYGRGDGLNQINSVASIVAPLSNPNVLLLSDLLNHRVLLWNIINQQMRVVAGRTSSPGIDASRLNSPFGLALDENRMRLYIADRTNNRIQRYDLATEQIPITTAGFGLLNSPRGITLDTTGDYLFICDGANNRILLWQVDDIGGRVLVGNGTAGRTPWQLNNPSNVRFDDNYNMYVVDTNNCRIQRFNLLSDGC